MAWVAVPGSNGVWEYDNAASSSYPDAPGTVSGGVRTYNKPGGGTEQYYVKCRKTGEDLTGHANEAYARGELNKNYYDGKI